MNAIKLSIALIVATVSISIGQESEKYLKLKKDYNYYEGYIITLDSSKIIGLVKDNLMSDAKKYSVVNFVHTDGTKEKYRPGDLKGFGYSIYKFESDNSSFYKVIEIGEKVSLYKNVSVANITTGGAPGMPAMSYSSTSEDYYFKKTGDSSYKLVSKKKFKENFSKYFEDCELVKSAILNGELTHEAIRTILLKYNFYCD